MHMYDGDANGGSVTSSVMQVTVDTNEFTHILVSLFIHALFNLVISSDHFNLTPLEINRQTHLGKKKFSLI